MTDPTHRTLVEVIASSDALWLPHRRPDEFSAAGSLANMRRAWFTDGMPFVSSGGAAERQAAGRALTALAKAGMVEVLTRGVRSVRVRPTTAGDAFGRGLAGLPSFATSSALWDRLRKLSTKSAPWVDEMQLAGIKKWNKDALLDVEDAAQPLMWRGWVVSLTAGRFGVAYRPNPAAHDLRLPDVKHPAADAELADHYIDTMAEVRRRLIATDCSAGDIGPVPINGSDIGARVQEAAGGCWAIGRGILPA